MKKKGCLLLAVLAMAASVTLVGCKKKEPATPPPARAPVTEEVTKQAETMKEAATEAAEEAKKTVTEAAAEIEQIVCPVMEGPINKDIFTEYQGKKVYFCCPACKEQFEADPQKYLAKLPQFNK